MPTWLWIALGLLPGLPFLLQYPRLALFLHRRCLAPVAETAPALEHYPKVSIIFSARDEEEGVGACLQALAAIDYPALEVIAVDDRSTDGTGVIIDSAVASDERLQAIHVDELPAGWLGKTHGLHVGAQCANGEFLIFTDGDVVFEPDVVRLAVRHMVDQELDHLCLFPNSGRGGAGERLLLGSFAFLGFGAARVWAVRHSPRAFAGVGAFNMVRTTSYQASGGHEALPMEVVDDVWLARRMKLLGLRSDALLGLDHLGVQWHTGAFGIVRGLEKNCFAVVDYSLVRAASLVGLLGCWFLLPWLVVALLWDVRCLGFAASIAVQQGAFAHLTSRLRLGVAVSVGLPGGIALIMLAILRSTWCTMRRGGVSWRDTLYPLHELRRHLSDRAAAP